MSAVPYPILIEEHDEDGVHWGVSLDGPNPELEQYVACVSKEEADELIDQLVTDRSPNPKKRW